MGTPEQPNVLTVHVAAQQLQDAEAPHSRVKPTPRSHHGGGYTVLHAKHLNTAASQDAPAKREKI